LQELEKSIESLKQQLERRNGSWGWEEGEEEMESMTSNSPAIFGVPNHAISPHPANNHNHKTGSGQVRITSQRLAMKEKVFFCIFFFSLVHLSVFRQY
jgi:hypothetical protein